MLTIWSSWGHTVGGVVALVAMMAGVIAIPGDGAGAAGRRLRVDHLFEFESVQSPVISPDGRWVAYTLESIDAEEDKRETSVWMVNRASGESLRMTRSGIDAHTPRWSPEGTYLSFLSGAGDDPTQVWLLNRAGGEARQLTSVKRDIADYAWSPDGKRLALVIRDADPAADEGDPEKPRPWVIDRLLFKKDGVGYLDRLRTHLYALDLASEKLTQITGGDYDDSAPAWSPDGRSIAFVSNRSDDPDANYNTDLWLVRADEIHTKQSPRRLTSSTGPDEAPVWSPDGKRIAYRTTPDMDAVTWYAMEHVAIVSAGGGEPTLLTKDLDRRAVGPQFHPDGSAVYFRFEDQRSVKLARVSLAGGDIETVIDGERCVDDFALAADGSIVALVSELDTPGNLSAVEPGGLRPLTRHNDALLAGLELAEVESTNFSSRDGTEIQGFIYKPPGFSKRRRYPTLIRIHGGPWAQYDYRFDFRAQLFAAHGYVVVLTNPRGSTGRGMDFRMGIWQSWGVKDVEDVLAGVDHAVDLGYADPDRLGVGGWSWGGILTNYVITQTDRFKAAVSIASYGLNASNYGHDLWQRWWERELGLPWENRALWEQLSSFNEVEKIVTPTLWMCGEKDWNVPAINSEQMYQAMKRLGRDTLLVIYPGQDHGISRPSFRKDLWERNLAWYDAYLSK